MKVFVVSCYDDGVLAVFENKEDAEAYVKDLHKREIYHEEDLMVDGPYKVN